MSSCNNVISQGFISYITKPTRITSNSATHIGHIYSNHSHPNHESGIIITDIADHFAVFHIIYGTPRPQISVYLYLLKVRQLNPRNIATFINQLPMTDFSTVLYTADVNEAYDNVMIIYKSLFELSCPVKHVKVKTKLILNENLGLFRVYWLRR